MPIFFRRSLSSLAINFAFSHATRSLRIGNDLAASKLSAASHGFGADGEIRPDRYKLHSQDMKRADPTTTREGGIPCKQSSTIIIIASTLLKTTNATVNSTRWDFVSRTDNRCTPKEPQTRQERDSLTWV